MNKVKDYMTGNVDFCTTVDNVYEAAVKMKDSDVGFIPICDNGRIVGVITDRDIVVRGVAGKKPGSTKVTEIMSKDLQFATPDMSIEEAADLMAQEQIRRLPVVENDKLVGVIALGDIAIHNEIDSRAGYALSEISEQHGEMHH